MLVDVWFLIWLYSFQFSMDFNKPLVTKFELESIDDDIYGYCMHDKGDGAIVRINAYNFIRLPEVHQKELIYHELLHCEYELSDIEGPGIMNDSEFQTDLNGSNWDDLILNVLDGNKK